MRTLGLAILAVFLTAFTIRSLLRLRGWRHRARQLPTAAIARAIAPHVAVPAVLLWFIYNHLGTLVFGGPLVWNWRSVGAYYLPDIALLLLAVVPDLLQAVYITGTVAIDRRTHGPSKVGGQGSGRLPLNCPAAARRRRSRRAAQRLDGSCRQRASR